MPHKVIIQLTGEGVQAAADAKLPPLYRAALHALEHRPDLHPQEVLAAAFTDAFTEGAAAAEVELFAQLIEGGETVERFEGHRAATRLDSLLSGPGSA